VKIGPYVSFRAELGDTLKLAGPIVLNQVGHLSMGLVDTLVAGGISTTALAALGLAANFFWTFTSVCAGCLLALDTYFSQAVGAHDETSLRRYLGQSFWTCAMITIATGICVVVGSEAYGWFAPPSGMRDGFGIYTRNVVWCTPSIFFFFVVQRYWQARHRVLPFTIIVVSANVLNLLACLALGLGYWGFPRLGIQGLALCD
jgi:MATE family multidrug resistance protein